MLSNEINAHLKKRYFLELNSLLTFPGYDFETQRIWNNGIISLNLH